MARCTSPMLSARNPKIPAIRVGGVSPPNSVVRMPPAPSGPAVCRRLQELQQPLLVVSAPNGVAEQFDPLLKRPGLTLDILDDDAKPLEVSRRGLPGGIGQTPGTSRWNAVPDVSARWPPAARAAAYARMSCVGRLKAAVCVPRN